MPLEFILSLVFLLCLITSISFYITAVVGEIRRNKNVRLYYIFDFDKLGFAIVAFIVTFFICFISILASIAVITVFNI